MQFVGYEKATAGYERDIHRQATVIVLIPSPEHNPRKNNSDDFGDEVLINEDFF